LGAKHWGAGFHGEIASDVGVCVCVYVCRDRDDRDLCTGMI
jgi:hypothetical protein